LELFLVIIITTRRISLLYLLLLSLQQYTLPRSINDEQNGKKQMKVKTRFHDKNHKTENRWQLMVIKAMKHS